MRHLWLKSLVLSIGLSGTVYAQQQQDMIFDALNILVGAYNGAVQAMAENRMPNTPKPLAKQEVETLKKAIIEGQQNWEKLLTRNGEVNLYQLGMLLNDVQKKNGHIDYDFERALGAFNGIGMKDISTDLLDDRMINELAAAANNPDLKQNIKKSLPYAVSILKLANKISEHPEQVSDKIRNMESETLMKSAVDQLKILYTNQQLKLSGQPNLQDAHQDLAGLYQEIEKTHGKVSTETYTQFLDILKILGSEFSDEYQKFLELEEQVIAQENSNQDIKELTVKHKALLKALKFDTLPKETQQKLLKALQH